MIAHPDALAPWHCRIGPFARAFVVPKTFRQRVALYLRGWRHHSFGQCWAKASPNQRRLEQVFLNGWRP